MHTLFSWLDCEYFKAFSLIYAVGRPGFTSYLSYISCYPSSFLQDTGHRSGIRINTVIFNNIWFYYVSQTAHRWTLTTSFTDYIMVNLCCLCCGEIPQPRPPPSGQSGPPRDPRSVQQQQPAGSGPDAVGLKGEQKGGANGVSRASE